MSYDNNGPIYSVLNGKSPCGAYDGVELDGSTVNGVVLNGSNCTEGKLGPYCRGGIVSGWCCFGPCSSNSDCLNSNPCTNGSCCGVVPCSVTPNDCTTRLVFRPYFDDSYSGAGITGDTGAWPKSIRVIIAGNVNSNLNMTVDLNGSNYSNSYGGGNWNKTLSPTMSISVSRDMGNGYSSPFYSRSNPYYGPSSGGVGAWNVSINEIDPNGDPEWGPTTISSFNGTIPVLVHRVVSPSVTIEGVGSYNLELSPIQEQKTFFTCAYCFATLYGDVETNYPQGDSPNYGYGRTFWYNMSEYTTTREYFDQGIISGGKCVSVITGQRNGYQYSPAIENLSDITDGQRSIKIQSMG
jgi:hypothetical protein